MEKVLNTYNALPQGTKQKVDELLDYVKIGTLKYDFLNTDAAMSLAKDMHDDAHEKAKAIIEEIFKGAGSLVGADSKGESKSAAQDANRPSWKNRDELKEQFNKAVKDNDGNKSLNIEEVKANDELPDEDEIETFEPESNAEEEQRADTADADPVSELSEEEIDDDIEELPLPSINNSVQATVNEEEIESFD